jgi:2-iminobutanoate/2-iminopropanoate deaminase
MSEAHGPVPFETARAPRPAGHYSQAVIAGAHLYVSGQLPIRPDGTRVTDGGFAAQASQALANVLAIVADAGGSPERIVRVTAYIVGVDHWPRFDAVYRSMLPGWRPARSVVPVPELHYGFLVEIEAVAWLGEAGAGAAGSGLDR